MFLCFLSFNFKLHAPPFDATCALVVRRFRNFAENQLSGTIPPLEALQNLQILYLLRILTHAKLTRAKHTHTRLASSARLTTVLARTHLSTWPALPIFSVLSRSLQSNQLGGRIPSLANLLDLQYLYAIPLKIIHHSHHESSQLLSGY